MMSSPFDISAKYSILFYLIGEEWITWKFSEEKLTLINTSNR